MNLRRLSSGFAVLVAAVALVACGSDTSTGISASVSQVTPPDPRTAELTLDVVNKANSTLQELTGASLDKIEAGKILINATGNMTIDALDPAKPTEYNQYTAYWDGRTNVRPYDYGGEENLPSLRETLFAADAVSAQTLVDVWKDSFERVKGERSELHVSMGPTVARADDTGPIEISIVNGTDRDRQTVYYDADGKFLRVK